MCTNHVRSHHPSLNGSINVYPAVLDFSSQPTFFTGHCTTIESMDVNKATGEVITGGGDGSVVTWTNGSASKWCGGAANPLNGGVHSSCVSTVNITSGGVVTSGWDDSLRVGLNNTSTGAQGLGSQPKSSGGNCGGSLVVVALKNALVVSSNGSISSKLENLSYSPLSVAVSADEQTVCVGGSDNKLRVYSVSGGALAEKHTATDNPISPITALSFSPSGELLATGDAKEVRVYKTSDWTCDIKGRWQFHTSKITCLDWSLDGEFICSGGQDESIFIWSKAKKMKRVQYKFTHKGGVSGAAWVGSGEERKIVSCGLDGVVCNWDVLEQMREKFDS